MVSSWQVYTASYRVSYLSLTILDIFTKEDSIGNVRSLFKQYIDCTD